MRSVEKSAKTLEEAIRLALLELGCREEEATIQVLEEPGKRLFGILGAREARVRVTEKEQSLLPLLFSGRSLLFRQS